MEDGLKIIMKILMELEEMDWALVEVTMQGVVQEEDYQLEADLIAVLALVEDWVVVLVERSMLELVITLLCPVKEDNEE